MLLLATAIGTVLFWTLFFGDLDGQQAGELEQRQPGWFLWERSFWLADLWLSGACLLAARNLWRGSRLGLGWTLVSGGALVFLGLMDILFFLQNGLYLPLSAGVAAEAFIHLWVTILGSAAIAIALLHMEKLPGSAPGPRK
jgi:hypothetical protein